MHRFNLLPPLIIVGLLAGGAWLLDWPTRRAVAALDDRTTLHHAQLLEDTQALADESQSLTEENAARIAEIRVLQAELAALRAELAARRR